MAWHPSGPALPGHPKCGPGMIWDHDKNRCISVTSAKGDEKRKTSVGGVIRNT